jgi:hypothetical protein
MHQSNYTMKVLEKFNMKDVYPLNTTMVVRSLDVEKDPFRLKEEDEEILGPEYPYFSASFP